MRVRLAEKGDLKHFVEYAMYLPNLKLLGKTFIHDMLSVLFNGKSCFVIAEEKNNVVGAMVLCDFDCYKRIPTLRMKLKFLFRGYGQWKHLIRLWRNSRKMPDELENSWHGVMIAVHPEFRKHGIGELMWKKFAETVHGVVVTFLIEKGNIASARWTEEQGAQLLKEIPDLFERGKNWLLYMVKIP